MISFVSFVRKSIKRNLLAYKGRHVLFQLCMSHRQSGSLGFVYKLEQLWILQS